MNWLKDKDKRESAIRYLAYAILLIGVGLRLSMYLQNRNLFIDESDIARNIYERNFIQLTQPLSYYQFAPPLFLWGLKVCTTIFGYWEYAYKIVPLCSGIAGLFIFYQILRRYGVRTAVWYPLFLLATGMIYLRYATEVKQYSSDSFVALCLIYIALSIDILSTTRLRFLAIWVAAGSVAIWGSMPSVFVLGGVGLYYLLTAYQAGDTKKLAVLIAVGIIWALEFLLYYEAILKPQIQSEYLQNFHKPDFLFLIPHNIAELKHNWGLVMGILEVTGGHWALSLGFHMALLASAMVYAIRRRVYTVLLLVTPIALLLLAAALHQFTLLSRVILFIMPVILVLIGVGLEQVVRYKYVNVVAIAISLICLFNFSQLKYFYESYYVQQMTDSLRFLKEEKISGSHLYVHAAGVPAYTYYTTIHPQRAQWSDLRGGCRLQYTTDFDSVGALMHGRSAVLYAYEHPESIDAQQAKLHKYAQTLKHQSYLFTEVYIYQGAE